MIFYLLVLLILLYMIFGNPFHPSREQYEFLTVDSATGDLAIVDGGTNLEALDVEGGGLKTPGSFQVDNDLTVNGNTLAKSLNVTENQTVAGTSTTGNQTVNGTSTVTGNQIVSGTSTAGNQIVNGTLEVAGDTKLKGHVDIENSFNYKIGTVNVGGDLLKSLLLSDIQNNFEQCKIWGSEILKQKNITPGRAPLSGGDGGSWDNVACGCSYQSGGDNTIHFRSSGNCNGLPEFPGRPENYFTRFDSII